MKAGISTACLYPLETERSLEILLKQGFRTFEIFANCQSELTDNYINRILNQLKEYGAEIYSFHPFTSGFEPFLFFTDYKRRYRDAIELYKKFFTAARKFGAKVVVFHGDRKDGSFNLDQYCERLYGLIKAAKEEGVILAQENVSRCKSGKSAFIKGIRKNLGSDAKFVLDIKQILRADDSIKNMLTAMGGNIVNVHINDNNQLNDCLLPGKGNMNFEDLVHNLKFQNYKGPLMIEVYRDSIKVMEEITKSKNYLTAFLD